MAPIANFMAASGKRVRLRASRNAFRRTSSGLLFLLDGFADDVGHIGIAFLLLLDEGGIVEARIDLDLFGLARRRAFRPRGFLFGLLLRLGLLERDEFSVGRLWHDCFNFYHRRRPCDGYWRNGFGPRARRRRNDNWYDLAGIGRDHRRLTEIVELAAGVRTDALGAEISFRHGQVPRNGR